LRPARVQQLARKPQLAPQDMRDMRDDTPTSVESERSSAAATCVGSADKIFRIFIPAETTVLNWYL
jgi:hypothetical protein